jgi:erythromycin esterase-like protein
MSMSTLQRDAAIVAQAARRISSAVDYDALIERAGEAQLVLIGEASHGTHEFYATRAELTKRLIDEKGFRAVALEADWPDSFRVHRFVTGRSEDASAAKALSDFRAVVDRWPEFSQWKEKGKGSAVVIRPTLYWRRCRATPPLKASLPCKILKCLQ